MTANISQHVVPRGMKGFSSRVYQRGTISPATVSISFGLLTLSLLGILGFFYLQQIVNTASQGADIHELESRITELKEHQRQLELEGAQLRSLQAVQDRIEKLNLVQTDRVTYLAPTQDRVALSHGDTTR